MIQTTGVGSLPHHVVDAALGHSFEYDIPFMPQLPIKNPAEYMIPQALEGLPGLSFDQDGMVQIDYSAFEKGFGDFTKKVANIIAGKELWTFPVDYYSAWKPFLFELQERKVPAAKVQLTGPLTSQWLIASKPDLTSKVDLATPIVQLITAKTLTMAQKLISLGVQPYIFFDEPGLYAFNANNPRHLLAMMEMRILVSAIRKTGAIVGIHCCSNANWKNLLESGIQVLSFDVGLSLDDLLKEKQAVIRFIEDGGRFSLGIIPTNAGEKIPSSEVLVAAMKEKVFKVFADQELIANRILKHSIVTPACGLALKTIAEAEAILDRLNACRDLLNRA